MSNYIKNTEKYLEYEIRGRRLIEEFYKIRFKLFNEGKKAKYLFYF